MIESNNLDILASAETNIRSADSDGHSKVSILVFSVLSEDTNSNLAMTIVATVCVIAILAITVVLAVLFFKRRKKKLNNGEFAK